MTGRTALPPEQREHPSAYDDSTVMRMLVEDALMSHATELRWFTAAIGTIAMRSRKPAEDVFTALVSEVEALGGHMPLHSGPIPR